MEAPKKGALNSQFEKTSNADKKHTRDNVSGHDIQEKIDTYQSVSQHIEQHFKLQALKREYLKEKRQREANRSQQATHYAHGIQAGLPHKNYGSITNNHRIEDQKLRTQTARAAKEIYRSRSYLKQELGKGQLKGRLKDRFKT